MMKIIKKLKNNLFFFIIFLVIVVFLALFFSYKILDVPMGLTSDETAMGYNACLLSHIYHDENGRFLPFFVLSNEGRDWKQPVTQYYLALLFKLFKPSVFLLRFSSVIITIISLFLIYKLSRKEHSPRFSLIPVILFLTTPLIMIQSHMGLDNIMPIPFTIIWLYFLFHFCQKPQIKYIVISALSLGITFYTYKGMRAIFPVWYLLSLIYLFKTPRWLKSVFIFSVFSLPFLLISPLLNHLYPGSILGGSSPKIDSIYNFIYPYLSSFDPTFLFIKGDDTLFHSTGIHGMFLLVTLPIFLIGIFYSVTKNKNSRFLLAVFFLAPIFYGLVNSVHRASRLMCLIPPFVLICSNGFEFLKLKLHRFYPQIVFCSFLLIFLNYADFLHYYYSTYAKLTQALVGELKRYESFEYLLHESQKLNLTPYISEEISNPFYESIYFPDGIIKINQSTTPPSNSILLSERELIDNMRNIKAPLVYYKIHIN